MNVQKVKGRPRTASDEAILGATARAISARGPARLTLAHVAAEVGLSPAALVQRFGSKIGLLRALAATAPDGVDRAFDDAAQDMRSPLDTLVAFLASLVGGIGDRTTLANHLAFLQLDLTDEELGRSAAAHSRRMRARIQQLLEAAVETGELPAGTDTAAVAETVHFTYNGALIGWAIDGRGRLQPWVRRAVDNVLRRPG